MTTLGTLETTLLNALVSFKMGFQIALHRESFATVLTIEGLLFGVDSFVLLDLGSGERLNKDFQSSLT